MALEAKGSLAEQIAEHLAAAIIKVDLLPGDRIQELRIAKELEVGRSSVREALLILERWYLIDILPRRGAIVTELTEAHVRGLYEMFGLLLGAIVGKSMRGLEDEELDPLLMAIHKMDYAMEQRYLDEFYDHSMTFLNGIASLDNNPFIETSFQCLLPAFRRCFYMAIYLDGNEPAYCMRFFKAILESIFRKDKKSASEVIKEFIVHQQEMVLDDILRVRQVELAWRSRKKKK